MMKSMKTALLCGMLGCLCYGGGDWLMMYGDPSHTGALAWLTTDTAFIPQWRFNLAMALAFPGIVLYEIALFAVEQYIQADRERKIYHYLNAFGLTPWLALHLFYIMILTLFSWMNKFHFFQHYYPEAESVMAGRKYGFNIKSQLLKLLVIFPAASALAAWICPIT